MSEDSHIDVTKIPPVDLRSPQRQLIEWQIEHADLDALIDQAVPVAVQLDELRLHFNAPW